MAEKSNSSGSAKDLKVPEPRHSLTRGTSVDSATTRVESTDGARRPPLRSAQTISFPPAPGAKPTFKRSMSTDELLEWLREKGLGEKDIQKLEEEGFTGESFLLLNRTVLKELGVKVGGQMLIHKLLGGEASLDHDAEVEEVTSPMQPMSLPSSFAPQTDRGGRETSQMTNPSHMNPSISITNQFTADTNSSASASQQPNTAPSTTITNQFTPDDNSSSSWQQSNDEERVDPTPPVTPARNQLQGPESDEVAIEEETGPYCTTGCYEDSSDVFTKDDPGYMYQDKVWAGRQVLRVFFLNPELLTQWGLDTDTVLDWAMEWSRCANDERIPIFTHTTALRKADIRVRLSESEGSWCMVGMNAEKVVGQNNPTMVLNLKDHPPHLQRSLVIHEFGHALGLDHEHQRSDFWDIMKNNIDLTRVPPGQRARVQKENIDSSLPYDPDSIMHYPFELSWLKNPAHRDVKQVVALPEAEKKCLVGLHFRQKAEVLPRKLSEMDRAHLVRVYENVGSSLQTSLSMDAPDRSYLLKRRVTYPVASSDEGVKLRVNANLPTIRNAVWEARDKWKAIGKGLGVSLSELSIIEGEIRSPGDGLERVLIEWMHTGKATIDQLLVVLNSSGVNESRLADSILMTRDHETRRKLGLE